MSIKKEAIAWFRDIRRFLFQIPVDRKTRVVWLWSTAVWLSFFAMLFWIAVGR